MSKWLILDCSYMCYRSFHSTGKLKHAVGKSGKRQGMPPREKKTGVIFGFLRDVAILCGYHDTDRVAFCFDSRKSKRVELYPPYKEARRRRFEQMDEEEAKLWRDMRRQVKDLRTVHLPAIGFKNIFVQRGHEADDLIATICYDSLTYQDEGIVVASDHDLYQLLRSSVSMWNPHQKRFYTITDFKREWGILPDAWYQVKAFAGCSGDGVDGIDGVGEKTVAKWLRGEVPQHHKAHDKILGGMDTFERNVPLVKLPFEGTKPCELVEDDVTKAKWREVCRELGMTSLEEMGLGPDVRRRGVKPENKRRKSKGRKGFGIV